ncbi:MAG: hypothetical protein L3J24_04265 [Xanthomonadales bacterium]|nr:hypothetical protein [Xanthomonadales bacterium]
MNDFNKEDASSGSFKDICKYNFGTQKDRQNQKLFLYWTILCAVSLLVAAFLLKGDHVSAPLSWLVAIVPSILGTICMFMFLRFLREADEMMRKIELEGLALGFGVGVLFLIGYPLLEQVGLPPISSQKTGAVMLFAWVIGHIVARTRYQ